MDHLNVKNLDLKDLEKIYIYDIIGSVPVSFTMKMRGVPFEAGEKEIYEVRVSFQIND